MKFRKVACLLLVSFFVIPLLASLNPNSVAFPSLTDRNVKVWSSTALAEPTLIAMSADGGYIVTAEGKGYTTVWQEGAVVCLLDRNKNVLWNFSVGNFLNTPEVDWVSISNDGNYTAFGGLYTKVTSSDTGYVFLFDKSGQLWNKTDFSPWLGGSYPTWNMGAISGDGSRLVLAYNSTENAGNTYSQLLVYDTGRFSGNTGQFLWSFSPADYNDLFIGVSVSSDGQYVAVGGDYAIFLLKAPAASVHEGVLVWNSSSPSENFYPVRISADGKYVLTMNGDVYNGTSGVWENHVLLYDQSGSLLWNVATEEGTAGYGAFDCDISADGKSAVESSNSMIYFFDQTGLKWAYNTTHVDIDHVRISADGYFIVASATSGIPEVSPDVFHLNRFGKLIWEASQTYTGLVAISAKGEYFCSTEWPAASGAVEQSSINLYFSKKYFSYRFVTPDLTPLPISNLEVRWSFTNGTRCASALTNSTGWITFFDQYFVDYVTEAYYWKTKVGQYTLVKSLQYETVSDHTASLFDWTINIHDVANNLVAARVETYLWNGTLYDNRTASSIRFEDLPNQTYTVKIYYPSTILSGQKQIALTQEEQASTIIIDTLPPLIKTPSVVPSAPSLTNTVKISVNVTDDLSGVHQVTLSYRLNMSIHWTNVTMAYNSTSSLYEANIPPQPAGTNVTFFIAASDNTGKQSINNNQTLYFKYRVVVEFPTFFSLLLLLLVATSLILSIKRKPKKACSIEVFT